uniref:Uncharacterized protein n=1 Tax=Arundo donax TaxID=35708 RepID=A0A0A8Z9B9_ARUDO
MKTRLLNYICTTSEANGCLFLLEFTRKFILIRKDHCYHIN